MTSGIASTAKVGEEIAGTADGLEDLRTAAVVAELRAEARDVDVDRAIERQIRRALREVEQLLARQHLARALRERAQDRELVRRDVDRLRVERDRHHRRLEHEAADRDRVLGRAGLAADAPRVRADPGEQ